MPNGKVSKTFRVMPVMDEPFKRASVYLVGPVAPVSEHGNTYILPSVDWTQIPCGFGP